MKFIDPREYIIRERLKDVKVVLPILSYKGGVGKTTVSSLLALSLAEYGFKVGLLDMDFTNPTAHIVLGVDTKTVKPVEENGVVPPNIDNISFMTLAYYTRGDPFPLRGKELDYVFKEMFAVTIWKGLDFLIIDPPPTFTDVNLNILKFLKGLIRPVILSNLSVLSIRPTKNLVKVLKEISIDPLGVLFNISMGDTSIENKVVEEVSKESVDVIGVLRFDPILENSYGSVERLKRTNIYREIHSKVTLNLVKLSKLR